MKKWTLVVIVVCASATLLPRQVRSTAAGPAPLEVRLGYSGTHINGPPLSITEICPCAGRDIYARLSTFTAAREA